MSRRVLELSLLALLWTGCGDDGHDVEPRVVAGGGIADPGIDGEINIHVIDDDGDAPIAGAAVHVGDVLDGVTDADGLFVASSDDLVGPQIITVLAAGHVSSTWYGADGANVTIPLSLADPPVLTPPTATVTGSIDGWDAMQPPDGDVLLAIVGFTITNDDDSPSNEIDQPDGDANVCFKSAGASTPCAWSLRTRTGAQLIYAFVGHATPAPGGGEPTFTLTDFAYASGVDVDAGDTQAGVTLALADRAALDEPDVTLPSAPAGTDTVAALARLNLGAEGRLQLPISGPFVAPLPAASLFPGADYDLIGVAANDLDLDPDANSDAQSIRINRHLDSVAGASLGTLLALPTAISTDGTAFSFTAVAGASLHLLDVGDSDDVGAWTAVILDGSTEVRRPDVVVLPDATLTYVVQAMELPALDVQDFAIDTIVDTIARLSADSVEFAN